MGFFSSSGKYLGAKSREHSAAVSKETNQAIAKDPNAPADARLRAGFRGMGDRWKQSRNNRQAAAHKHAAKLEEKAKYCDKAAEEACQTKPINKKCTI